MNAAARALSHGTFFYGNIRESLFNASIMLMVSLVLTLFVSAFAVVYIKDAERSLFSELQSLIKEHQQLQVERNQWLLEKSTWAVPARIQSLAEQRYAMVNLKAPQLIILEK